MVLRSPLARTAPPRPRRGRRSGFTIAEVMVAGFVLIFAITSSILVLQSGFRALDTARKTTLASQIMQSEMERIRMLSWTRVQRLADEPATIDLSTIFPKNTELEKKVLAQMESVFTATRRIEPLSDFSNNIIEITITITWRGIDGVSHNRSSSTRYSKDGLYAYYYTLPPSS